MKGFLKLFVFTALMLAITVVAVSCGNNCTVTTTTTTTDVTTTPTLLSTTDTIITTTVETVYQPTTKAPELITDVTYVMPEEGYVEFSSNAYISGPLVHIGQYHRYQYNPLTLVKSASISSSTLKIQPQNLMIVYGNKSQSYLLASSKIFIKADAFQALDEMMNSYKEATDKKNVQLVNGYVYSSSESLKSPFVTGYSIALNILDGSTYSLDSTAQTVTVNGREMTPLEWFSENAPKYGFVYTGMSGSVDSRLATFRYVGKEHALLMYKYGIKNLDHYSTFIKTSTNTTVTDLENNEWTIIYVEKDKGDTTKITLPKGSVFKISGDNINGFIIAYRLPKDA